MAGGSFFGPARVAAQAPQAVRAVSLDLEGELDVLFEDSDSGSRLLRFLQTKTDRIPLRFRGAPPDLPTGTRVRVRGDLADGTLTTASLATLAVAASRTLGAQDVLVVLMNFTVTPWLTVTADASTCAYSAWATAADSVALASGYDRTRTTGWSLPFPR